MWRRLRQWQRQHHWDIQAPPGLQSQQGAWWLLWRCSQELRQGRLRCSLCTADETTGLNLGCPQNSAPWKSRQDLFSLPPFSSSSSGHHFRASGTEVYSVSVATWLYPFLSQVSSALLLSTQDWVKSLWNDKGNASEILCTQSIFTIKCIKFTSSRH